MLFVEDIKGQIYRERERKYNSKKKKSLNHVV